MGLYLMRQQFEEYFCVGNSHTTSQIEIVFFAFKNYAGIFNTNMHSTITDNIHLRRHF